MRGPSQGVVVVLMAYAVMLILVSPAVPSPLSTMPSKDTVQPKQVSVPLAALLIIAPIVNLNPLYEMVAAPPVHFGARGSEVIDLTTARLC